MPLLASTCQMCSVLWRPMQSTGHNPFRGHSSFRALLPSVPLVHVLNPFQFYVILYELAFRLHRDLLLGK